MMPFQQLAPTMTELVPWTDRRGRFHPMRAAVLALLLAPGVYLGVRLALHAMGPEPVNAAIHSTGYYAVWMLLASLVVTPVKALAGQPNVVVVRRMIGNAAMIYAAVHLVLYMMDQHWRLMVIAMEIVTRFYLTIGFVALLGLLTLGFTSTDGWVRWLGRTWKRLHRIVYGLTVLGLFHYMLQSKLDVSQALLAVGVFAWLMLWRSLPAGRDRAWPWLLVVGAAATVLTLACEWLWYRYGTRIDPRKVLAGELDVAFGLHPAARVLLLSLLAAGITWLRGVSQTAWGATAGFTMLVYALGGLADNAAAVFAGWPLEDAVPEQVGSVVLWNVAWIGLMAALGLARWTVRTSPQRRLVDVVWVACILYNAVLLGTDEKRVVLYGAVLVVGVALLLSLRVSFVSRRAALLMAPVALLLAYQAATLG